MEVKQISLPKHVFSNQYGTATLEKYTNSDGQYRVSVCGNLGGAFRLSEQEVSSLGMLLREIELFVSQEKQQP
jgi:hypothetical protein